MPMMVHLTSEKNVKHILQAGIKGSRGVAHGKSFCNCPACIPRGQIKSKVLRERYKNGISRSGSDRT